MAKGSILDVEEFRWAASEFGTRGNRFARYWNYYKVQYPGVLTGFMMDNRNYFKALFDSALQPLFTPIARAVNIDVALIPGGWMLGKDSDDAQREAWKLVQRWSDWDTQGDLFARWGVAMGEAGLKVVDDRENGTVAIYPVRPDMYVARGMGFYDNTPSMVIFKTKIGDDEWAEVLEPDRIRTYQNGKPMGIDGRDASYENPLGYVPFVTCVHDIGDGVGESTFDDSILAVDMVNRQATFMSQMIEKHLEPQWAAFAAEPTELEKSGDTVWFFPEGADIKAILAQVDFPGLLAFVNEVKTEMKDGLPELAFAKLVGVERVAAATIELQMAEAVFKIKRLRKPHDQALAKALRLVGRAAGGMDGLSELTALDDPMLMLDADRPVVGVDALTRLQIEQSKQSVELGKQTLAREQMLMEGE